MALSTKVSSISFNTVLITSCGSFTISNNRETVDVTEIGSNTRAFISTVQTATASCEIFYDQTEASTALLEALITTGTAGTLLVTVASGQTYTASAIVTRFEITGSAGDVVRAAVDFQLTGAVTIV
jgi:predicted secreted protein